MPRAAAAAARPPRLLLVLLLLPAATTASVGKARSELLEAFLRRVPEARNTTDRIDIARAAPSDDALGDWMQWLGMTFHWGKPDAARDRLCHGSPRAGTCKFLLSRCLKYARTDACLPHLGPGHCHHAR